MNKRRQWIFALLCILCIYTITQSSFMMKNCHSRAICTVYQNNLDAANIHAYHSNLTFNSTKANESSTTKTENKQYLHDIPLTLEECVRRKSGKLRLSVKQLPLTALASPFRSGNTWVRHLLQMATGIGTSALYCDIELRSKGFPYECEHTRYRQTLVVKTHEPRPPRPPKEIIVKERNGVRKRLVPQTEIKNPPFERVVLLIRDPYNYLVANMVSGHLDVVKEENYFGESKWRTAQPDLLEWWKDFNDYWLKVYRGPVYPLLYSKLLIDTKTELIKLLNFLNVTYTDSDIRCAIDNKEGNFHRKHFVWSRINDITKLFNHTMKTIIDANVKIVSERLRTKYGVEWVNETHVVNAYPTSPRNRSVSSV